MLWVACAARQEEATSLERKLDYEELTPCLREVTKVWEDLLTTASTNPADTVPYNTLLDCVKKGSVTNCDFVMKNRGFLSMQDTTILSAHCY